MPNRIAYYRNKKGLTQEELAEKVGVSRVHMGKVERGDAAASMKLLSRIAKALNCQVRDIFFTHDDN